MASGGVTKLPSPPAGSLPFVVPQTGILSFSGLNFLTQLRNQVQALGIPPGQTALASASLQMPPDFTVTQMGSGTSSELVVAYADQSAHAFLAGPVGGPASAPLFRLIQASDVPPLPYVTSVGLTMPAEFAVAGSPITTHGTLAVTKANEAANLVAAGPAVGAPAPWAFRSLVAADLPAVLTPPVLVAALGAGIDGKRAFVTDSTVAAAGNFGAIVAGTGANHVPVYYDGANWRIG